MKRFLRIVKRFFLALLSLIVLFAIAVAIFMNTAPQVGRVPEGADLERISASPNFRDGIFFNLQETTVGEVGDMLGTLGEYFNLENGEPSDSLPVRFGENEEVLPDSLLAVTWYGHSAFLFEIGGKRVLIDPMLSEYAAPIDFGSKRFPYKEPIPIEELTDIDAMILSHDHYDHLDYKTVLALADEVGHYYTALGVGSHLKYWGVAEGDITELDWYEEAELDGLTFIAAPSRHFSGRGLTDRFTTQWASWIVKSAHQNIYFSGDGGYGDHFLEIGEKYGPFDIAFMECGQYNKAWPEIHMMPEQSVQAGLDVRAEVIMPIHWGAFQLAIHEWTDPIIRFKAAADSLKVPVMHPYIGERVILGEAHSTDEWWNEIGR